MPREKDEFTNQDDPEVPNREVSKTDSPSVTVGRHQATCQACNDTGSLPAATHIEDGKTVIDKYRECPMCYRDEETVPNPDTGVVERKEVRKLRR